MLNIFLYSDIYFPKLAVSFNFAFYLRHIVHYFFVQKKNHLDPFALQPFILELLYYYYILVTIYILEPCKYVRN